MRHSANTFARISEKHPNKLLRGVKVLITKVINRGASPYGAHQVAVRKIKSRTNLGCEWFVDSGLVEPITREHDGGWSPKNSAANIRHEKERAPGSEKIDRTSVFERDGWKCQICGIETPKNLLGAYNKNAPELDHIIPLSRGGKHIPSNIQCACRSCNFKKSNHIYGLAGLR